MPDADARQTIDLDEEIEEPDDVKIGYSKPIKTEFEYTCLGMLINRDWEGLITFTKKHLKKNHANSWKAFFYFGIGMYKTSKFVLAIAAFEKAEHIFEDDA